MDEQYVACLIECAVTGFDSLEAIRRTNIRRRLRQSHRLRTMLTGARMVDFWGVPSFNVDISRVRRVLTKLARGHINYELSNVQASPPDFVTFTPVNHLNHEQLSAFMADPKPDIFPEIGSRQFLSLIWSGSSGFYSEGWSDWKIIQPGRYQYVVEQKSGDSVRILLSDYLCCEVIWD
ncbi:MAG: hypothetical protein O3B95_10995 [Chloroflexi bacterium]|nr:hypothetical protein [Chloroflexota bacterium]